MSYTSIYTKNMKKYMGARNDAEYQLMLQCHKEEYIAHAALYCTIKSLAQWAWNGFK